VGIDFILQERGAGGGAPPGHVSLIQDHGAKSGLYEMPCDECSRDACADDDHVALHIPGKRAERGKQSIANQPIGMA
jgi:hypothetical protein